MQEVQMVELYLRAQNMEQLGRIDDALDLYEQAVAGTFDSTGPYDRLIHLYGGRAQHADVVRIADAALRNVQTYDEKRRWYERMRAEADRASNKVPKAAPRKRD